MPDVFACLPCMSPTPPNLQTYAAQPWPVQELSSHDTCCMGNYLSNTTCLKHMFSSKVVSNVANSISCIRQATPLKTNEAALDK